MDTLNMRHSARILTTSWYGEENDNFALVSEIVHDAVGPRCLDKFYRRGWSKTVIDLGVIVLLGRKSEGVLMHYSAPMTKIVALIFSLLGWRKLILVEIISARAADARDIKSKVRRWIRSIFRTALRRSVLGGQVMTHWEVESNAKLLGIPVPCVTCIPWPLRGLDERFAVVPSSPPKRTIVFASGRAACDWETLMQAGEGQKWPLTIVCSRQDRSGVERLNENVGATILSEVPAVQHAEIMNTALVYVLALEEISASSGQIRLSQAIDLGVPVVASDVRGLSGYLIADVTAWVVQAGKPLELRSAVNALLSSAELRMDLAQRARAYAGDDTLANYKRRVQTWALRQVEAR